MSAADTPVDAAGETQPGRRRPLLDAVRTLGWELPLFGAATFVDQGGRLLLNVVAAAVLGPVVFGSWVLAALLIQYANFVSLGVTNGAGRQIPYLLGAERPEEAARAEDVALLTTGLTGLAAGLVAFLIAPLVFGPEPGFGPAGLLFLVGAIVLQQFFLLQQVLFRSRLRFRHASLQLILTGVAAPVVGIVLVLVAQLDGLLAARFLITCFVLILAARLLARLPRPRWDREMATQLVRVGLPILTASILFALLATIDRWLVLTLLGREQVGYYGLVAVAISGLLMVPVVVSQQFYPRLGYAHGQGSGRDALLRICRQQSLLAAALTTGAAAFVAVGAVVGIPLLLPAYRPATVPILIVVAALVVYAAGSAYGSLLNVVGRQRWFLVLQLVAICVDVAVAVILVSRGFGLEGIALAFLIAMSLYGSLLRLTALRVTRDLDDVPPTAGTTPETHVPAAA